VLRKHLCDCHSDAWIAGCDKLGIDITAKAAQRTVRDYRHRSGESVPTGPEAEEIRQAYTKERFLDALVDFVASEDVVRLLLLLSYL